MRPHQVGGWERLPGTWGSLRPPRPPCPWGTRGARRAWWGGAAVPPSRPPATGTTAGRHVCDKQGCTATPKAPRDAKHRGRGAACGPMHTSTRATTQSTRMGITNPRQAGSASSRAKETPHAQRTSRSLCIARYTVPKPPLAKNVMSRRSVRGMHHSGLTLQGQPRRSSSAVAAEWSVGRRWGGCKGLGTGPS